MEQRLEVALETALLIFWGALAMTVVAGCIYLIVLCVRLAREARRGDR